LFKSEQELIARVEGVEKTDPDTFGVIKKQVSTYVRELQKSGVTDRRVQKAQETGPLSLLFQLTGALLALPVFAAGFIFSALPYYIPRIFITPKLKDKAFVSSFHFALGLVLYPLFYLAESALILLFTGSLPIAAAALAAMPFAGKIALQLVDFYEDLIGVMRLKFLERKKFRHCNAFRMEFLVSIERNIV
jgi:hypothetical protein